MMWVLIVLSGILLWAVVVTYAEHRHFIGLNEGMQRGYTITMEEMYPYLPWNATSEYLLEWAQARQLEELVSFETEEFLKTI